MSILPKIPVLDNINHLRILIALLSFILSVLAIVTDDLVNSDGILYTNSAEAFVASGLAAASNVYDWPTLPILGAVLSKWLFISPLNSLYLLSIIFFVLLTDALTLLVHQSSRDIKITAIASILILSFYTLNEYRDFIIRDTGYWAFSALALFHLINFLNNAQKKSLHLWQLFAFFAALFRIEGLVILMLMPLTVLFVDTNKNKLVTLLRAYLPFLFIAGLLALAIITQPELSLSFQKVLEVFKYIDFDHLTTEHSNDLNIIADNIIAPVASDQANTFYFSGLLGLVAFDIFTGLSVGLILLMLCSFRERYPLHANSLQVLRYFLIINILILVAFVLTNNFISTRYCMMAIITIMLLFLPKIALWVKKSITHRETWKILLIILVVVFSLGDTFHQSSSKAFYKDSAAWSSSHIKDDQNIFTNNEFIYFYLDQLNPKFEITYHKRRLKPCNYNYFFISDKHITERIQKQVVECQLQPVIQFKNKKEKITIYKQSSN